MAKGLRSKVKRRYRTVKRVHVQEVVERPKIEKLNERINYMINNKDIHEELIRPPNKFLHPNDENAVIPKHQLIKKIDFRSQALPISGLASVGNRRKYSLKEKLELKESYGNVAHFNDNIMLNKLVKEMHARSKEVMKLIEKKENNKKI